MGRRGAEARAVGVGQAHHDVRRPDVETAGDAYAARFAGPVGRWFLTVQAVQVLRLLRGAFAGGLPATVLDLGGGHAQLAPVLADAGVEVTAQGSDPVCAARLAPVMARLPGRVRFQAAPLDALPFADRSFDAVIAVRLLAHAADWRPLLGEMARITRTAVLVDFAPADGSQRLAGAGFGLKRRVEGNTRPFFTQSVADVAGELARHGLTRADHHRQFLLPMAAHRALGRPGLSRAAEAAARAAGLARITGGPVLLCAHRPAPPTGATTP
ncbi:MAG: hypothetical protein RLY86_1905 [Pseudomonadota bacterium]